MNSYELRGYNYQECVDVLSRWLQAMVTEICQGRITPLSFHIDWIDPDKWRLLIIYIEK